MGQIGRFLDRLAAHDVALARDVLDAPFGRLTGWTEMRSDGTIAGCLVSTVALCHGRRQMGHDIGLLLHLNSVLAPLMAAAAAGVQIDEAGIAAGAAGRLARHLGDVIIPERIATCHDGTLLRCPAVRHATPESEARAVELIKRRLRRAILRAEARGHVLEHYAGAMPRWPVVEKRSAIRFIEAAEPAPV